MVVVVGDLVALVVDHGCGVLFGSLFRDDHLVGCTLHVRLSFALAGTDRLAGHLAIGTAFGRLGGTVLVIRPGGSGQFGPRQLVQVTQPEDPQESTRRPVDERSAQFLRAAHDPHQVALHQLPQDLAALHAADRLDRRSQHGLTIGHYGERLHRRNRQPHLHGRSGEPPQPRGKPGSRHQLKTAGHLHHAKRTTLQIVHPVQSPDQCTCFGPVRQAGQVGQFPARQRVPGEKQHRLQPGDPFGPRGGPLGNDRPPAQPSGPKLPPEAVTGSRRPRLPDPQSPITQGHAAQPTHGTIHNAVHRMTDLSSSSARKDWHALRLDQLLRRATCPASRPQIRQPKPKAGALASPDCTPGRTPTNTG